MTQVSSGFHWPDPMTQAQVLAHTLIQMSNLAVTSMSGGFLQLGSEERHE